LASDAGKSWANFDSGKEAITQTFSEITKRIQQEVNKQTELVAKAQ
jgi:hypothetical protein